MKFEAHITLARADAIAVNEIAQFTEWTYSQIDGDPIMGKEAYCYLTAYDTSAHKLHTRMMEVVHLCQRSGAQPLRTKIEAIVFDSKTDVDVLSLKLPTFSEIAKEFPSMTVEQLFAVERARKSARHHELVVV